MEIPRALGKTPFKPAPLPEHLRRVWRWFCDLNETRLYDRSAKIRAWRMPHSEIAAWSLLSGVILEQWQFAALTLIDEIYVDTFNDEQSAFMMPSLEMTPQLFDAMFGKSDKSWRMN